MNISQPDLKLVDLSQPKQAGPKTNSSKDTKDFLKHMQDYLTSKGAQDKTSAGTSSDAEINGNQSNANLTEDEKSKIELLKRSLSHFSKAGTLSKTGNASLEDGNAQLMDSIQALIASLNNLLQNNSNDEISISDPASSQDTMNLNGPKSMMDALNLILESMKSKLGADGDPNQNGIAGGDELKLLMNSLDAFMKEENTQKGSKTGDGNSDINNLMMQLLNKLNPGLDINALNTDDSSEVASTSGIGSNAATQELASKLMETLKADGAKNDLSKELGNEGSDMKTLVEELIGKLNSTVSKDSNVEDRLINNLNSIMNMVKSTVDKSDIKNLDTNLRAEYKEILSEINPAGDNPSAGSTGEDFKNKLVETLVLLTKDSLRDASKGNEAKGDTAAKFTKLFSGELNKENTLTVSSTSDQGPKSQTNDRKGTAGQMTLKDDKILNSVIGKNEDSKTSKVNTFISQLNSPKDNLQELSASEKPVISKVNLAQDIVKAVKFMNVNNLKELTVRIDPKELGEITIKLTMEEGNMKASISAHNKDAFNLLSSNVNDLKQSLESNNIKVQNVEINIYQDDTTFFSDSFNKGNRSRQDEGKKNNGSEEVTEINENFSDIINNDNNISALA